MNSPLTLKSLHLNLPTSHKCQELCTKRVMPPAGNFFSAAFEDTCLALVGASGGVFGMVGLFIADMIVNFSTIKR